MEMPIPHRIVSTGFPTVCGTCLPHICTHLMVGSAVPPTSGEPWPIRISVVVEELWTLVGRWWPPMHPDRNRTCRADQSEHNVPAMRCPHSSAGYGVARVQRYVPDPPLQVVFCPSPPPSCLIREQPFFPKTVFRIAPKHSQERFETGESDRSTLPSLGTDMPYTFRTHVYTRVKVVHRKPMMQKNLW